MRKNEPAAAPVRVRKNRFGLLFPIIYNSKKKRLLNIFALVFAKTETAFSLNDIRIEISGQLFTPRIYGGGENRGRRAGHHLFFMRLSIPQEATNSMAIQNPVLAVLRHDEAERDESGRGEPTEHSKSGPDESKRTAISIDYNLIFGTYIAAHGPYLKNSRLDTVAFFRQNIDRSLALTVRQRNVTDAPASRLKLYAARLISVFYPLKRPILLYEKNAGRYEESAKLVYESLIDGGYKNSYYVIDRSVADGLTLEQRYRQNFIYKHSFRHYTYFFRSKTFIGTEAISHCMELRAQNPFVQQKVASKNNTFVFLQHGVMYMVSLDSPQRSSFRKKAMRGKVSVVVSSKLEADHFAELAGFEQKDMIVCGLPKFDRSYANADADKILIMPTWRIWEFNAMRDCPDSTDYIKMIDRIKAAIPEELKHKVIVAPHPLFDSATNIKTTGNNQKPMDELLREVRLLITDYSSIAYDAFYRGANVIFYWQELDECMAHYGEPTHLMLTENLAFGPVCYSEQELAKVIKSSYEQGQGEPYTSRYKKLVTYHDNKNTERLLTELKRRKILGEH
jgi:hypothetical protein